MFMLYRTLSFKTYVTHFGELNVNFNSIPDEHGNLFIVCCWIRRTDGTIVGAASSKKHWKDDFDLVVGVQKALEHAIDNAAKRGNLMLIRRERQDIHFAAETLAKRYLSRMEDREAIGAVYSPVTKNYVPA